MFTISKHCCFRFVSIVILNYFAYTVHICFVMRDVNAPGSTCEPCFALVNYRLVQGGSFFVE